MIAICTPASALDATGSSMTVTPYICVDESSMTATPLVSVDKTNSCTNVTP